jgi:integrase
MAGEGALSDATIRALPIPVRGDKEHVYKVHWFAGAMVQGVKAPAGFGVRVGSGGAKVFVLNYRLHGREYRYTIGQYPTWTATEAVRAARDLRKRIDKNENPLDDKHSARGAATVSELADLYLDEGPAEKPNKKASSWQTDRSNIERHIKPLLGRKIAASLTQADVARFQADVAAGKNKADVRTKKRGRAIVSGGKGTAARSLAVLGAMSQFAVGRGLIAANPAKGVRLLKQTKRERFLSVGDLARLADTLATMQQEGELSSAAAAAIRLLLLTGARKGEILTLRWDWVDAERSCLRLPDSKTGAKVIPLASAALELLNALPQRGPFALPAGKGKSNYTGLQKDWERVREHAGLTGVRIHDLRHSFASFAVADGHSLFLIGKVLGHKQARTTEGYAHLADDPLRIVADKTAARIAAAMTPAKLDNVVPLAR